MAKAGRHTIITPQIKDLIFQILEKNPDATVFRIHGERSVSSLKKKSKISNEKKPPL